jgi:hypothetical protein
MKIIVDEAGEIIAKATDDRTLIGGHHRLAVAASLGKRLFWRDNGEPVKNSSSSIMEALFDIQPEPLAERIVVRVHRGGRHRGRAAGPILVEELAASITEGEDSGRIEHPRGHRATPLLSYRASSKRPLIVDSWLSGWKIGRRDLDPVGMQ